MNFITYAKPGSREYYAWQESVRVWRTWERMQCELDNYHEKRKIDKRKALAMWLSLVLGPIVVTLIVLTIWG
jgi:hypothetical protein